MSFSFVIIALLSLCFGLLLGYVAMLCKVSGDPVVETLNAALPQTQCGQCSFAGCRPYAEAIASGAAPINQCPPGGENTIAELAQIMGVDAQPLNEEHGQHAELPLLAEIVEAQCIGCTLCIQACPVDAILGAAKHMHTVLAQECTGCELCLPPCPVDCIVMKPVKQNVSYGKWLLPEAV